MWLVQLKALWAAWKNVVLVGLMVASFLAGWEMKSRSIVKQFAKEESKGIAEQAARGEKAVKDQVVNTQKLGELEKENDDLRKRLKELGNRSVCVPNDDELRILDEIQKSTE